MNLVLVGINHRTAPVEVRERMNIQESRLPVALSNLVRRNGIAEGLILSTCNRVEVTANAEEGAEAETLLRQFLLDYHHCDLSPWEPYFYWRRQEEVVRHLFRVASSLDSMILGEPQILGQVKRSYAVAREVGALSGVLGEVVNHALGVARRVRRETALGSAAVSVPSQEFGRRVAELARQALSGTPLPGIAFSARAELTQPLKESAFPSATARFPASMSSGSTVTVRRCFRGVIPSW